MKYYKYLNDATVTYLLRQANIKTKNHLMAFSDYSWQDFPDTGEVQEHTIFSIKVGQLTMAHIFQVIDLSIVYKSGLEFFSTQISKVFYKSW